MQNLMCASRTLFDEFAQTEREYRAREAELQREIDALRTRVDEVEQENRDLQSSIDDYDETFEQIDSILGQAQDRFFGSSREYGYEVGPNADDAIHQAPMTWGRNFVNALRHWYTCLGRIRTIVIERADIPPTTQAILNRPMI
jgi:hypothetical protein